MPERRPSVMLTVKMDFVLHREFKLFALSHDTTMATIVHNLVVAHLGKHGIHPIRSVSESRRSSG